METFSMDEKGNIRRDLISAEELCAWADAYQKAFFPRHDPKCDILIVDNAGGPACFDHTTKIMYIEKAATVSEKLSRILLLHEMIHVNFIEDGQDPDQDHGFRFQAEVKRLFAAGAYSKLL
jgi:hypothetical protein